jgi:hypothetical protein
MIAVHIAGNNSHIAPACGQADRSRLTGTELQSNDVVDTRRSIGYRFDARNVWGKISVKIVNRERVNRGRKPMPSDELFRIIGTCSCAANPEAEDSKKTDE